MGFAGHFLFNSGACRQRHKLARTLLIVVADADDLTVEVRKQDLRDQEEFTEDDPVVVLIPKRHIETWICAAITLAVTEDQDCKPHKLKRDDIRKAARQIHD